MKLAVVGSRKGISSQFVKEKLLSLIRFGNSIISGGAAGVDSFAADWAYDNMIPVEIFLPDWAKRGKQAGAIRNQQIVDACDEIMIFWDGKSKGTKITFDMALKAGKPITLFVL